jgi:3D (Asp-Asp-Asp) domain-containing protein
MCFVIGCTGLPLQAKGTIPVSSKPPAPVKSEAKTAPAKPTPTQDTSRSAVAITVTGGPIKAKTPAAKNLTAKTSEVSLPESHVNLQSSRGTVSVSSSHTSASGRPNASERLARLTAYWAGEGDYYTGRGMSSTGVHLHDGHCAVDPRIIPYGSVVDISGLGKYLAVDTGSAVISREAARETGHNSEERNALVIDLYFESRQDGERFAANGPKYASISWTPPRSTASTQDVHSLAAE